MGRSYLKLGAPELEERINEANYAYWHGQDTGLSDAEFEAMLQRLRAERPNSPALTVIGPRPQKGARTVEHRTPMLSLRKASGAAEVRKWAEKSGADSVYATAKVDGIACSVVYGADGRLLYVATRGDGAVGEVITSTVLPTGAVPEQIDGLAEVRGELFITKEDFKKLDDASCARNSVAGYVKRNEPDPDFPLRFYPYDVLGREFEHHRDKIAFFAGNVFDTRVPLATVVDDSFEDQIEKHIAASRPLWEFDADGLVFRVDSQQLYDELGCTSHHPKGAIALKFEDDLAVTTVTGFEWAVSRAGTITPVAKFEPVRLAGAKIESATLHHVGKYRQTGIRVGSKISIARRGGVIPHVMDVISHRGRAAQPAPPQKCPFCDSSTVEVPSCDSTGIAILGCAQSQGCPGAQIEGVIHYASVIGIKGLGPALAETLYHAGYLTEIADLYRLKHVLDEEDKEAASIRRLLDQVESTQPVPFAKFLTGIGIPTLGPVTADRLASRVPPEKFLSLSQNELQTAGIGYSIATSIYHFVQARAHEFDALWKLVRVRKPPMLVKGGRFPPGPLAGATILFTGPLQLSRADAIERAEAKGAEEAKSVTKELTFLVAADAEGDSSKLKKARELIDKGAPLEIIDEETFLELVE